MCAVQQDIDANSGWPVQQRLDEWLDDLAAVVAPADSVFVVADSNETGILEGLDLTQRNVGRCFLRLLRIVEEIVRDQARRRELALPFVREVEERALHQGYGA